MAYAAPIAIRTFISRATLNAVLFVLLIAEILYVYYRASKNRRRVIEFVRGASVRYIFPTPPVDCIILFLDFVGYSSLHASRNRESGERVSTTLPPAIIAPRKPYVPKYRSRRQWALYATGVALRENGCSTLAKGEGGRERRAGPLESCFGCRGCLIGGAVRTSR